MREEIIREVQRVADTKKQKIDASISSRVASKTLDVVKKIIDEQIESKCITKDQKNILRSLRILIRRKRRLSR